MWEDFGPVGKYVYCYHDKHFNLNSQVLRNWNIAVFNEQNLTWFGVLLLHGFDYLWSNFVTYRSFGGNPNPFWTLKETSFDFPS